jgi:hypothetical protein
MAADTRRMAVIMSEFVQDPLPRGRGRSGSSRGLSFGGRGIDGDDLRRQGLQVLELRSAVERATSSLRIVERLDMMIPPSTQPSRAADRVQG